MTEQSQARLRYSDSELAEFKAIVLNKLSKAEREYSFYREQMSNKAEESDSKFKELEDGTASEELERLVLFAARQEKIMQHLQSALVRIENKIYGICRQTGKLIPKERLRAVPHATLSVDAKRERPAPPVSNMTSTLARL